MHSRGDGPLQAGPALGCTGCPFPGRHEPDGHARTRAGRRSRYGAIVPSEVVQQGNGPQRTHVGRKHFAHTPAFVERGNRKSGMHMRLTSKDERSNGNALP